MIATFVFSVRYLDFNLIFNEQDKGLTYMHPKREKDRGGCHLLLIH